jgi:hypothetical protein
MGDKEDFILSQADYGLKENFFMPGCTRPFMKVINTTDIKYRITPGNLAVSL